jgi:hypothetical protein
LRRKVFHDPPTERNRVWQTDFSEFETAGGGTWRICAVIDYATKYCLAARTTPTGRGVDALACLDAAVDEAERVLGLDDFPTEGPVTATRHRAGLTRHPVIELAGGGSQRRSCAGGGSDVRQLGRRPSAPPWTWSTAWQLRGVGSSEVGRVQALANAR